MLYWICGSAAAGVLLFIVLNHDRAVELALTHLYGLGHRRIAIIKGQPFSSETEVRWKFLERVAGQLGLPLAAELPAQMEEDLPTSEPGYRAARKLLQQGKEFSAIFAFNDVSAIGAISALREAGLSVPEDVSVLGFDDVAFASVHRPSFTTVRQPLHEMGVLAPNAVLEQLNRPPDRELTARQVVVEPELVVRSSTMTASRCR